MIKDELNAFKKEEMVVHEVPEPTTLSMIAKAGLMRGGRRVDLIHISFEFLELHWLVGWLVGSMD
jgi:hypothetical protein